MNTQEIKKFRKKWDFATPKSSVKHRTFVALFNLAKEEDYGNIKFTFSRKDIQMAIWIAQGKSAKTFVVRQGYYCDAIQKWESECLLKRVEKNTYTMTKMGWRYSLGTYEEGVKLIRENNKNLVRQRKAHQMEKAMIFHLNECVHRANCWHRLVGTDNIENHHKKMFKAIENAIELIGDQQTQDNETIEGSYGDMLTEKNN